MNMPGGGLYGGTNDVSGTWDGTVDNSTADLASAANVTLSSPTVFAGYNWIAYNAHMFSQGTYNFTESGSTTINTMTVGTGQVGVHMLFGWGAPSTSTSCGKANCDIGVADVMNLNSLTGNPTLFYTGATKTADAWSGNSAATWGLATANPIGNPMVNGPFTGFNASFNLSNGAAVAPVAPVPLPAAFWLLGSGLIGMVGVARRRKSGNASGNMAA